MLYLHTILPIVLLPTSMTLLLALLGLLLRTKALGWAGLVVRWLASTALVGDTAMRVAEGWQVRVSVEALPYGGRGSCRSPATAGAAVNDRRYVDHPGDLGLAHAAVSRALDACRLPGRALRGHFCVSVGRACTMLDLLPDANTLRQTAIALRAWYGWLFYQLVRR